ncbi:MAG: sulfite exporter TauE/SafE family protein [Carboxylicivirga sp.]|jgi:uncharacterized membrane protein YfcA|nr:sulfite exporter TauE/SafE family protein [Carboxylicivirga sp.]
MEQYLTPPLLLTAATLIAFVFALGGSGGATLMIPLMHYLDIPMELAIPTGLSYNVLSLTGASLTNVKYGVLDFRMGMPIIVFSVCFAALGAYFSPLIDKDTTHRLFIILLLASATTVLFIRPKTDKHNRKPTLAKLAVIGSASGLISGILGIGGGSIIAPSLLIMGCDAKKVTVIIALSVPFSGLVAFLTFWYIGNVDWNLVIMVSTAGTLGAIPATMLKQHINPSIIKHLLATLLLLAAAKMIVL